jgi:hypothetical protein
MTAYCTGILVPSGSVTVVPCHARARHALIARHGHHRRADVGDGDLGQAVEVRLRGDVGHLRDRHGAVAVAVLQLRVDVAGVGLGELHRLRPSALRSRPRSCRGAARRSCRPSALRPAASRAAHFVGRHGSRWLPLPAAPCSAPEDGVLPAALHAPIGEPAEALVQRALGDVALWVDRRARRCSARPVAGSSAGTPRAGPRRPRP